MTIVTNSVLFVHNQTNGYIYAPQYSGTVWPAGPLGGRSGLIPLTNDYVISITITTGGSNYVSPVITVGKPWTASTLEAQNTQVVSGANLYTVVSSGTSGTVAPTDTSGNNFTDGTATLKYAGKAAVVTATPNGGTLSTGYVILQSGGSGYTTTPSVYVTDTGGGSGAVLSATLNGFPLGGLVPGVAYLDTYTVVGQSDGRLYCCNTNDVTSWNALAYVTSYSEPGQLVGIAKHLNFVAAFGQWSTSFFYDAGNAPPVSPLALSSSYTFEIGCANGTSIATIEQSVLWVGQSKDTGPAVYMLNGLSPTKVSTAFIEKALTNSTLASVLAYTFKYNGHTFYVLTLHDVNQTLVYDIGEKEWYQWTMWAAGDADSGVAGIYAEQYFRPSYYAGTYGTNTSYYLLDDDNGTVYTLSDNYYNDSGSPIYYRIISDLQDSGTTKRKFWNRAEIIGDKAPATMKVRYSDNDYKTWSSYRSVDLSKDRPIIYQLGGARRRAFEFLCTDNTPLRLDACELDFRIGELEEGQ